MPVNDTKQSPVPPRTTTLTLRGVTPRAAQAPTVVAETELQDHTFHFVWSPDRRRPRERHPTLQAAEKEATRLAELHPGMHFDVYHARRVGRRLK
jgi:hypothetical protein